MNHVFKVFQLAWQVHKWKVLYALLLLVLVKVFALAPPAVMKHIIDAFVDLEFHRVYQLLAVFVVLAVVYCGLMPFSQKYMSRLHQEIMRLLSVRWSKDLLKKDFLQFENVKLGTLISSIERGLGAHETLLMYIFKHLIPNVFQLLLVGGYIIYEGGVGLLPVLALSVLGFVLGVRYFVKSRRPYIDRVNDVEDRIFEGFSDVCASATSIKIADAVSSSTKVLNCGYEDYSSSAVALSFASGKLQGFQNFGVYATAIFIVTYVIVVSHVFGGESVSSGTLAVIFAFAMMFMQSCSAISNALKDSDQYESEFEKFSSILQLLEFREGRKSQSLKSYDILVQPGSINISSDDKADSALVLSSEQKISIPYGSKVAIIGASGAGKSLFSEIISGLKEFPYSSKAKSLVSVGECDLSLLSSENIAGTFFFAEHKPKFLNGSFYDAVLFSQDLAKEDRIAPLLRSLSLEAFLPYLAKNANPFPVKTLSSGEQKRLGVLRAILQQKPITILDEPTEALDKDLAKQVWQVIFSHFANHSLICITHDTSTLDTFDMVLHFEGHKIQVQRNREYS